MLNDWPTINFHGITYRHHEPKNDHKIWSKLTYQWTHHESAKTGITEIWIVGSLQNATKCLGYLCDFWNCPQWGYKQIL